MPLANPGNNTCSCLLHIPHMRCLVMPCIMSHAFLDNVVSHMRSADYRIPPYFALIIRAISVLEGVALVANPDFAIVDEVRSCMPRSTFADCMQIIAGVAQALCGLTGIPLCCQETAHGPEPQAAGSPPIHGEFLILQCPLQQAVDAILPSYLHNDGQNCACWTLLHAHAFFWEDRAVLYLSCCNADLRQGEQVQCSAAD